MAFDSSQVFKSVFGNKAVSVQLVTADANSGAVDVPMGVIDCALMSPVSCTTFSRMKAKKNTNSGGTSLNGTVQMSSCTSGDDFYLVCFGR